MSYEQSNKGEQEMSNMYFGDWRVRIIDRPQYSTYRVYMMRLINGATMFFTHNGTVKTIKEGDAYQEDDVWFAEMSDDQLQAFADSLASKGIKTINDHKNEGLLEATKYHLEDMRKIAKL